MPNPLRRPRSALPPPTSLALLSTLRPRLSEHVTLSLPPSRRLLQVRADHLLLFRRGAAPGAALDVSKLQLVLSLRDAAPALNTAGASDTSVRLAGLKLTFASAPALHRLRTLAHAAATAAAARPRYTLGAQVGHGATSVVRAAEAAGSRGSAVAVKLLPKAELLSERGALDNLLAERAALHALAGSPHAVRLVDAYQTRSHVALVTELAALGDLQAALSRLPARRFSVVAGRALAAELVLAVGDAHRAGRVVRDVKLANALLTGAGRVRLADFGLAKALVVAPTKPGKVGLSGSAPESLSTSSVTDSDGSVEEDGYLTHDEDAVDGVEPRFVQRAHSFVGTRRYMAPEVAAARTNRAGYAGGADVWALGVALHVLLTGRYPFRGGEDDGVVRAGEQPSLAGLRAIDADAADLVGRMLCADPLERADLADVRRHAFFADVRWAALREQVRRDADSPDVLRELRDAGVAHALSEATAKRADASDEAEGNSAVGNWELLGFEYFGEASH